MLLFVKFDKTKKVIDIETKHYKLMVKDYYFYLINLVIMFKKLNNIKYTFDGNLNKRKYLYYNDTSPQYYNTYDLSVTISYNKIYKNKCSKERYYTIIPVIMYTYYAYFIYSKYYNSFCSKNYLYNIKSISLNKIFNCRDLYRLISFI
jgi:hypothetical protein